MIRRGVARSECVHASAPLRVDLAGGTLDLWPLGLLAPGGATVASAISLHVTAVASPPRRQGVVSLTAEDLEIAEEHAAARPLAREGRLPLLQRIVALLGPPEGVALTTRSPVRQGSGLGTSSALGIAAAAALARMAGRRLSHADLVTLVRDLEAQVLGIPTGTQDHQAALLGGALILSHAPGGETVWQLPGAALSALAERLVIFDSGRARSSAPSNWDMFRRRVDGDPDAVRALAHVATAGAAAAVALGSADWRALGRAMRQDLEARREWSGLVVTPALERMFDAVKRAGALGWKVCGAGGGGFAIALCAPSRRTRVANAVEESGGRVSEAHPTDRGLRVTRRLAAARSSRRTV